MRRLRQHFPAELVIIGVHSAKFPSEHLTTNIRQAVLREDIRHPVVNDTGFRIWSEYNVRAWPTLVLIDPRGRIAGQVAGEIQAETFIPIIEKIIAENAVEMDRTTLELAPEAPPDGPLRFPTRILPAGDRLWIADSGHHRIIEVRLDPGGMAGEVLRILGSGQPGLRDGGPGDARFQHPHGMALRGSSTGGTLYVADTGNHAVRSVDLGSGEVTTLAGTGEKAHGRYAPGAPTDTPLRSPWAVAVVEDYLMIAMAGSHQVWVLTPDGQLGPFAGSGAEALEDGPVAQAAFNQPSDLALGEGQLFVADAEASAVRTIRLDASPLVSTLVGMGLFEFGDVDGVGEDVRLQHAAGLAYADRLLYIADTYNHKIKILDPLTRRVQSLAGSGRAGLVNGPFNQAAFFEPEGVAVQAGRMYVADTNNHRIGVADLGQRRVVTFGLRGTFPPPARSIEELPGGRLDPQEAPAGSVRVVLDVSLPPGQKRNPDAPTQIRLDGSAEPVRVPAGQPLAFELQLESDREVGFELALVTCSESDASTCTFEDRRLVLPLRVRAGAPAEIHVPVPMASSPARNLSADAA